MADPAKLAALEQFAATGSWGDAQGSLGASKDAALSRQSALGGLTGASPQATASTMPTVEQPYGRFAGALQDYMGGYQQSAATLGAANDTYFEQVAQAQSAHLAEADRAIAEAQASASRRGGGGDDYSQWELEALAEAKGQDYQEQAAVDEGALGEQNAAEAELAKQLQGWSAIGEGDAESDRYRDAALGQATEDEQLRARQAWEAENLDEYTPNPEQMSPFQRQIIHQQIEQERQQWVDEWAGSDRLGGPRTEREQEYITAQQEREPEIVMPGTGPDQGLSTDPGARGVSEVDRYAGVRDQAADQAFGNQEMLENYTGPEFTRKAFVDLNLRPELGEEGQRLLAQGMFEDLSPKEEMEQAEALRQRAYFEQTGFSSPTEERSWNEAERKNSGAADPNNRQVRRPDDPDIMTSVGLNPDDVARITSSDQWEAALQTTENMLEGTDEETIIRNPDGSTERIPPQPPVRSAAQLRIALAEQFDDEQLEKLIVAMYAPSMVG
jgi:hypothetical protein